MKTLTKREVVSFQKTVWGYYKKHGRKLPWRPPALKLWKDKTAQDPYKILVSEIMLQQTQASRVLKKYPLFIKLFPTARALARASFHKVLSAWSGLGYNRRARFLHETAQSIVKKHKGKIPSNPEALKELPGLGLGTVGAIAAFAFNEPSVFIETNIRAVFIHHFFKYKEKVRDEEIFPLIEQTLGRRNSREWYYALMDYGVALKEAHKNPSRKSALYMRQSSFKNSNRRVRGEILKVLVRQKSLPLGEIKKRISGNKKFLNHALRELEREKFITVKNGRIAISR